MQDKKYGGYGHLLDDEQKKEVDKVKKSVAYINLIIKWRKHSAMLLVCVVVYAHNIRGV